MHGALLHANYVQKFIIAQNSTYHCMGYCVCVQ